MKTSLQNLKVISRRLQAKQGLSVSASHIGNPDRDRVLRAIEEDETVRNTMAYSLAMATREGSEFPPITRPLTALMKEQLQISKNQLQKIQSSTARTVDDVELPRTLADALLPSSRAIVVTEKTTPFRIFNVNKAWEGLCGYSYVESKGQSLGSLLRGPETDPLAVTALITQLLRGEEATALLTNYTKSGRKFRNRLQVGPLYNDNGELSHFVGVLQEVKM